MQQRRLRLGDIVDDYCPRERRITNHAIVAMIEDEVKQTRCTTCDADHEYKQARIPAQRRKKDTLSVLPPDGAEAVPRRHLVESDEAAPEAVDAGPDDTVAPIVERVDTDAAPMEAAEAAPRPNRSRRHHSKMKVRSTDA